MLFERLNLGGKVRRFNDEKLQAVQIVGDVNACAQALVFISSLNVNEGVKCKAGVGK